jgi:catechol 2,3-dioxygenase-like lactoylglutathione lyase family enzyme
MLSASQLAQLIVSTRDLPAAADFYHRRLGLPLLAGDGAEVRVDAGGAEIRLCRDRFTSAAGGPAARDVACSPVRWHDVGALASVRDPDGHRIMLCQPSPAALDGPVGPWSGRCGGRTAAPGGRPGR